MTALTARQRRLTLTVEEAAALLGIGRHLAYEQIRQGTFPVRALRIGVRIVVPRAPLLALLGVEEGKEGAPNA
jgi:excisionase family DNA binding protein